MDVIKWVSSKLFTQWRHLLICRMVAETISVISSDHSYQHNASDLNVMYMFVIKVGQPQEFGATYNISLCVVTIAVFNILIFSETTSRWRLILCHYIP